MRGNSHHKIIAIIPVTNPFLSPQEINLMAAPTDHTCFSSDLPHLSELKFKYHPDKGGNQEEFINFAKCLEYLKRK